VSKIMIPAVIVAVGAIVATAWSQTQPIRNTATVYFTTPLENDATRVVLLRSVAMPVGGATDFHRHPGDQWYAFQEGEATFTIKGQPSRVVKAGDSVYIPRGTIHRLQNLSGKPARTIELLIIEKDKPPAEAAE
jgi:quercetin dioxygenase-like cupin family protein